MILIVTAGQARLELEVAQDMTVLDLTALIECETDIPAADLNLYHNHQPLSRPDQTIADAGLADRSHVLALRKGDNANQLMGMLQALGSLQQQAGNQRLVSLQPGQAGASSAQGGMPSEARLRQEMETIKSDPYTLSILKEHNPDMADAIVKNDFAQFSRLYQEHLRMKREAEQKRREMMQRLEANPYDPEVQKQLEEEIRLQNIEASRQHALEYMPESFARVVMLYVRVKVNGHELKAFVDSGAQMTIMSKGCAERCEMMRLVDTRFAGVAVGVGQQKIIGRVHVHQLEIAGSFLPVSFSILENQPMDMLLGLDMLRRHQCCIDLKENCLIIGTTGTKAPFLAERELPAHARGEAGLAGAGPTDASTDSAQGTSASSAAPAAPAVDETAVMELMSLGAFTREQAIEALRVCDGNKDSAAAYLFQSMSS